MTRRIVGLILVVALTIFASLAETLRNNIWASYRDYTSPYLADLPAGPPRSPASQRVVLVLVRGLRMSDSNQMDTLNSLRKRGVDVVVQHSAPTYRLPSWVTLFSGASTPVSGVTTNFTARASSVDTIFRQIQLAGGSAAIVGSQALGDTYGGDVQRFEVIDNPDIAHRDDDAVRTAQDILKDAANPVQLLLVELTAVEDTQQANPNGLPIALTVTDTRIKTLLDMLDMSTNTLVVMSDRGLTTQGADGGDESDVAMTPLVMAGAGVAAGGQSLIQLTDVAPTLAALIGAPIPVHTQGVPLLSALSFSNTLSAGFSLTPTTALSATAATTATLAPLPAALWSSALQLTTFYESWSEAVKQPRFAAELLRAEQDGLKSGDLTAFEKYTVELHALADTAIMNRLNDERAQRMPVAAGAALAMIALIGVSLAARRWQPLLGMLLYLFGWYAAFYLIREDRNSLSMFTNSDPTLFLNGLARDATALLVGVCVFVALTTGKHEDGLDAIATVLITLLLIVLVQVGQALWFYLQWGFNFTWNLPDSAALVAVLVALTQASALSIRIVPELPSLPLPLFIAFLTLAIYSLVRRRPRREQYGRLR